MGEHPAVVAQAGASQATDFSPAERAAVETQLEAFLDEAAELPSVGPAEYEALRVEVGELRADLHKLNKKQWFRSALGWLVTAASRFGIPVAHAEKLLEGLGRAIRLISGG